MWQSESKNPSMGSGITKWADNKTGEFKRQSSIFRNFISAEPGAEFPAEKDRYHLYVSYACPWGMFGFCACSGLLLTGSSASRTHRPPVERTPRLSSIYFGPLGDARGGLAFCKER